MVQRKITIVEKIIEHYGVEHQKMVACEELAELIQEISKSVRYKDTYDVNNLKGEIADVFIVIQELMVIHNLTLSDIIPIVHKKFERQEKRMRDEDLKSNKTSSNM